MNKKCPYCKHGKAEVVEYRPHAQKIIYACSFCKAKFEEDEIKWVERG